MNWVCLIDTQSALNLGTSTMPELDEWMSAAPNNQGYTVDSLFGCSSQLPKLMVREGNPPLFAILPANIPL